MAVRTCLCWLFFALAGLVVFARIGGAVTLDDVTRGEAAVRDAQAAVDAQDRGDDREAIRLLSKALASQDFPEKLVGMAERSRGASYLHLRQPDLALRDLDDAIARGADDPQAYLFRGQSYYLLKNYDRAVEDFDRATSVTLADDRERFAFRAMKAQSEFYAGRFAAAAQDSRAASDLKPTDLYYLMLVDVAAARAHQDGRNELRARTAKLDLAAWPGPVVRLLLGDISPDALVAAAAAGDETARRGQQCEADFYIGETALAAGNTAEAGRRFKKAIAGCPATFLEYTAAKAELQRMAH